MGSEDVRSRFSRIPEGQETDVDGLKIHHLSPAFLDHTKVFSSTSGSVLNRHGLSSDHLQCAETVGIMARSLCLVQYPHLSDVEELSARDDELAGAIAATIPLVPVGPHEVDWMRLRARVIILCTTMCLHLPRSDLPDSVPHPETLTHTGFISERAGQPNARESTGKAIEASFGLVDLISTTPSLPGWYSPTIISALILGCIVQLAAASYGQPDRIAPSELQRGFERVSLLLETLRQLGQQWLLAQTAFDRLRQITHLVFRPGDGDAPYYPEHTSWFDLFNADNGIRQLFSFR